MFNLNDSVVYPGHGVAKVNRIINKVVAGHVAAFYELKFLNKDMTILVPTNTTTQQYIRPLCSGDTINDIFAFLAKPAQKIRGTEVMTVNWKQRKKEYDRKLLSGNLEEISAIYRELKFIEAHKELSFCEKILLQQTEALLAEEISHVKHCAEEKAIEQLRSFFNGVSQKTLTHRTL